MITVEQIRAAAEQCEGIGNKVFVAEVARKLGVPLDSIASVLIAAHRAGTLPMSRWDLAQAMHVSVDQAAINHLNGQFHVVRLSHDVCWMPTHNGEYYYSRDAARVTSKVSVVRTPSKRERQEQAYEAWQAACAAYGEDSAEAAAAWTKVNA